LKKHTLVAETLWHLCLFFPSYQQMLFWQEHTFFGNVFEPKLLEKHPTASLGMS
jgi:hypothetical protein